MKLNRHLFQCTAATISAQLEQNLEWPHGTSATPNSGAIRHTSQQSRAAAESDVEVPKGGQCRRRVLSLIVVGVVSDAM
jgi:hypothetical protein